MTQHYSDPDREGDKHALPDTEVFQMTAREVAERDEDMIYEYLKRHEFRLATMNSRTLKRSKPPSNTPMVVWTQPNTFERAGSYWYWQPDDTYAGPFRTLRAATLSAQRQFAQMYPVSEFVKVR